MQIFWRVTSLGASTPLGSWSVTRTLRHGFGTVLAASAPILDNPYRPSASRFRGGAGGLCELLCADRFAVSRSMGASTVLVLARFWHGFGGELADFG